MLQVFIFFLLYLTYYFELILIISIPVRDIEAGFVVDDNNLYSNLISMARQKLLYGGHRMALIFIGGTAPEPLRYLCT